MFTGIIEEVGTVCASTLLPSGQGRRLKLAAAIFDKEMAPGASICTDGVCLTAVRWQPGYIEVEVGPETLSRTTLGMLGPGDRVNLERALRLSDRLGGHLVSGHVDGVGTVLDAGPRAEAWDVYIGASPELLRYVVDKGSIAVDGISLTVNAVQDRGFFVSLVPHTQARTTLRGKGPGGRVNLEVDIIGKYVHKLLSGYWPAGGGEANLKEHGLVRPE